MTNPRDDDTYVMESALMHRDFSRVEKLRAALEAAEELEERGVVWEEAWRNDEDWQRLGRIRLLLTTVQIWIDVGMSNKRETAWRERFNKRRSIRRVK